jgi:hypothetical protein
MNRNYPALFLALDDVLAALDEGVADQEALCRSFEASADGFGADKAVLLAIDAGSGRLRAIASRGLQPFEVSACEAGKSVPGVSSSCIRQAVESGRPVMVQDAAQMGGAELSGALSGHVYSVLCAPISAPDSGERLAVLYVQNEGLAKIFGEIDRAWIEVYARALGRVMSPRGRGRGAAAPSAAEA